MTAHIQALCNTAIQTKWDQKYLKRNATRLNMLSVQAQHQAIAKDLYTKEKRLSLGSKASQQQQPAKQESIRSDLSKQHSVGGKSMSADDSLDDAQRFRSYSSESKGDASKDSAKSSYKGSYVHSIFEGIGSNQTLDSGKSEGQHSGTHVNKASPPHIYNQNPGQDDDTCSSSSLPRVQKVIEVFDIF
jgi:hypothetical protein